MLKNENTIFDCSSDDDFLEFSLQAFSFQYKNNSIYKRWVDLLRTDVNEIRTIEQIPFLPIEFFKNHMVISSPRTDKSIEFTSSATTSHTPSKHVVNNIELYEESFLSGFNLFYGNASDYCVLALLPNYLQRKGSSLVFMCKRLIEESKHPFSGFFLDDIEDLIQKIERLKLTHQKVLLIGVSYALMDMSDRGIELNENFVVMETGGMKGTRKELLKPELHAYLMRGFKVNTIHSEYGMTELLSQAYSLGNGLFQTPPWMKFLIREVDDPLRIRSDYKTGGINVIDLANINSCCFIATKDLGRLVLTGSGPTELELMGRYDHSDVRGCNLMMGSF